MTTQEDISFLRDCLKHTSKQEGDFPKDSPFVKKLWWGSDEVVAKVALILVENCILDTPKSVIQFFEKPYNWERDMENIVKNNSKMLKRVLTKP